MALAYSRDFISSLRSAENCYYPSLPIHTLTLPYEQRTAFYGREGDVLDLVSRLKSNTSAMINIYGPPGIGKSSLASIVALAIQDGGFAVYRADMRLVCDVEEVAVELLKAAGWNGAARAGDPVAEMAEWAGNLDEYTLLVLDNCDDFLTGSKSVVETMFENVAMTVLCLVSPQTCRHMFQLDQRKQKFQSLLSGLLRVPGHIRVITTTTAPDEVTMHTMMRAGLLATQFLVHPLEVSHSVSLLQCYVPNLNRSTAMKLANYVGKFPQALVALATTLQGGVDVDSDAKALMSKLEERDVYGFLIMTRLDSKLGQPTLAYRQSYHHLKDDVKKCGRILAQSNTRVFTPSIARHWLQSYASPSEIMHCLHVLEERGVLLRVTITSADSMCRLVAYQFRSLYKECFTFEQKKIWFPALKELRDFLKLEEQLLDEYLDAGASKNEWIQTYYCTGLSEE